MPSANHDELTELLGDVDELLVERLLETGASVEEVGEALAQIEDERDLGEQGRGPSSPRVMEVRSILLDLFDEDDDEDYAPLRP